MKLIGGFLCALLLTVFVSLSAQAQTYVICNTSPVVVNVCVVADCGGVTFIPAPCPAILIPGQCFTWPVPAGCTVTDIDVNGVLYPVQPAGAVVPLAPPNPPNFLIFEPYGPNSAEIQ